MTIGTGPTHRPVLLRPGHTNATRGSCFRRCAPCTRDIFSGKGSGPRCVNAAAASPSRHADEGGRHDHEHRHIITGHSRTMTVRPPRVRAVQSRLRERRARGKAAGKSAEETAKAWTIPAKYAGYAAPTPIRLLQNVQVVFDELK